MYKATRVLNAITGSAWAITEDALHTIVQVALRENETVEAVEARLGRPLDNTHTVTMRDGIATIPVSGAIFRYANLFTAISGGTTIDALAQDLTTALDNPAVKAIVLYIDSPGGEISGINEFAQMLYAARDRKPIVAYVADLGASAAYWIASACSHIVIDDTASVGSIGVVAAYRGDKARANDITFVSSQSPRKRPDPATEGGRSQIQTHIDSLADVFVETVARNRNTDTATVLEQFGQGGLLVGRAAVAAGMADEIGSYEQVLADLVAQTTAQLRGGPRMTEDTQIDSRAAAGPDVAALQAQLEAMGRQLAAERDARITTEAAAYVATQIRDARLLPAEEAHATALYAQLARDDAAAPLASGSRLDLLRATHNARPKHTLTEEHITTSTGATVLGAQQTTPTDKTTEAMSDERKKGLLAQTDVGRSVLTTTNGSGPR